MSDCLVFFVFLLFFSQNIIYLCLRMRLYILFKYFRLQITFRFIFLAMNFLQNTKYYLYVLLACCLIACKDDDKGVTDSPLTPDEHKAKLETIGKEFIAKINASDHETVVKSLNNLTEAIDGSNLEDLFPVNEVPKNETIVDQYQPKLPQSLLQVIKNNDANALMQLATKAIDDDEYRISDFEGIYTYSESDNSWLRKDAENKVELHYTVDGVASILSINCSGMKDYTKVDGVIVEVPAKTEMTLTVTGEKVMDFVTTIELSNDLYSAKINSTLTLNDNYSWNITADVKSEQVTSTFKMTVNNENLINGTVVVYGNKMTDPDYIEKDEEDIVNNGNFDFTIMNLQLKGNGNIKSILTGLDELDYIDPWDKNFKESASKANAEKEMKLYNDNMNITGFYVKENQKFVDVKMGIYSEEQEVYYWDGYDYQYKTINTWDVQPILVFTDKSEMDFETFFTESDFSKLIKSVETLINKYMDMVDAEHVKL